MYWTILHSLVSVVVDLYSVEQVCLICRKWGVTPFQHYEKLPLGSRWSQRLCSDWSQYIFGQHILQPWSSSLTACLSTWSCAGVSADNNPICVLISWSSNTKFKKRTSKLTPGPAPPTSTSLVPPNPSFTTSFIWVSKALEISLVPSCVWGHFLHVDTSESWPEHGIVHECWLLKDGFIHLEFVVALSLARLHWQSALYQEKLQRQLGLVWSRDEGPNLHRPWVSGILNTGITGIGLYQQPGEW